LIGAARIVPVIDSRAQDFYGSEHAANVRAAMLDGILDNRDWLTEFGNEQRSPDGRQLSWRASWTF